MTLPTNLETKLIHDILPIFKQLQSRKYQKTQNDKNYYRQKLSQYLEVFNEILEDTEPDSENYIEIFQWEKLMSLLNSTCLAPWMIENNQSSSRNKNLAVGPEFSKWLRNNYSDTLDMMISAVASNNANNFVQVVFLAILSNRCSDVRQLLKLLKNSHLQNGQNQRNQPIFEAYNSIDKILMQIEPIFNDFQNFTQKIDALKRATILPVYNKVENDYINSKSHNMPNIEEMNQIELMPLLVLKLLLGKLEEDEIETYLVDNQKSNMKGGSHFLTLWFNEMVYNLLFSNTRTYLPDQLSDLAQELLYKYHGANEDSYGVLDALVIKLLNYDIVGFCHIFCEHNSFWLVPFLMIDLIHHSKIKLGGGPNREDYAIKRKELVNQLIESIRLSALNFDPIIVFTLSVFSNRIELCMYLQAIFQTETFTIKINESQKIKIFHKLLTHQKLPREFAEKYAKIVSKSYEQGSGKNPTLSMQWALRSRSTEFVENKCFENCLKNVNSFTELVDKCQDFQELQFSNIVEISTGSSGNNKNNSSSIGITNNSGVIVQIIKFLQASTNAKKQAHLLTLLNSDKNQEIQPIFPEISPFIKLDILEILLASDGSHNDNIGVKETLLGKEQIMIMMSALIVLGRKFKGKQEQNERLRRIREQVGIRYARALAR